MGGVVHEDGVDVAFEVVDGKEWFAESEGEAFGVGDADKEGTCEAGAAGNSDGVEILKAEAGERFGGFGDGGADDGDDVAEVLAGGELRDDAAVVGVEGDLAGDDVREGFGAVANDSGGGLVAGGLDAEDQAGVDRLANSMGLLPERSHAPSSASRLYSFRVLCL